MSAPRQASLPIDELRIPEPLRPGPTPAQVVRAPRVDHEARQRAEAERRRLADELRRKIEQRERERGKR